MNAKMGRPTIENPNTKNLTIRISEELSKRIDVYCKRNNITKGELVRTAIELVIKK